jgi:hypothetical protein
VALAALAPAYWVGHLGCQCSGRSAGTAGVLNIRLLIGVPLAPVEAEDAPGVPGKAVRQYIPPVTGELLSHIAGWPNFCRRPIAHVE